MKNPKARSEGLIITEAGDDLLVYDQRSNALHTLNKTSSTVWNLCDGERTVEQITRTSDYEQEAVDRALDQLVKAELLEEYDESRNSSSRRRMLKKVGIVAIPAIVSVTVPLAAANASCTQLLDEHQTCVRGANCCKQKYIGGEWIQMACLFASPAYDEGSCEVPL